MAPVTHTGAISTAAASVAAISQQAHLPEKLQAIFSEFDASDVYLPHGVSWAYAASAQFFSSAHGHRVSAGFWTRNNSLVRVLQLLLRQ